MIYVTSWSTHKFPTGSIKTNPTGKIFPIHCNTKISIKHSQDQIHQLYCISQGTKILKADTAENQKSPILKSY